MVRRRTYRSDDVPRPYADEDDPETLIESALVGRYRVGETIGEGGMARVARAVDIETGEEVALKILSPRHAEHTETVARFLREGRALQNLGPHPNIVRVFDHGLTAHGQCFIALELLRGATLDVVMDQEGALPEERAIRLALDTSKALASVHERGMIHRDLKPENLFVVAGRDGEDEHVKLIDFGVAHLTVDELGDESIPYTRQGSMLGTAAFMSPEQIHGGSVDARSDVYSLGLTLYFMLTGAMPFEGTTVLEQVGARLEGRFIPMPDRAPHARFDGDLVGLVHRCLSHDMAERPGDGLALMCSLAACQHVASTSFR